MTECIICGNGVSAFFCAKGSGKYLKCVHCNHVFIAESIIPDISENLPPERNHHISGVKRDWDFSREKREKIFYPRLQLISRFGQAGKLLDIGCSNGAFIEAAVHYGWEAEGVELRPSSADFAKCRGNIVHTRPVEDLHLPAAYFHAITMWQVIEHIPYPEIILKECHRILKVNGVLAVTTPNIGSIGWKLLKSDWPAVDPGCHYHLFRVNTIEKIMANCGFKKCYLKTSEFQPATVKQLKRRILRQPKKKPTNAMATLVGSSSSAKLNILFTLRKLLNLPLQVTGLGEDIYGIFQKIS